MSRRAGPADVTVPQAHVITPAPEFDAEPATHRALARREAPASWLDRLLSVTCTLPLEAGFDVIGGELVRLVVDLSPACSAGLLISPMDEQGEPQILRHPPSEDATGPESGESRLFRTFAYERVVPLAYPEGSSLHVATNDADLVARGSAVMLFLERVAAVAASSFRTASALREAQQTANALTKVEAQMIQSAKLASLGQMAAGLVHELNNPLTSIIGYSDLLTRKAEQGPGDPGDLERLRRITEAAHRILAFSRDFMTYARPSVEAPLPVPVHGVIEQALIFCDHVLHGTSIAVEKRFSGESASVRGVHSQLTQVFVNLFTNASHAMLERGGHLVVSTERTHDDRAVRITVADTGHGIHGEVLPQIFEPFFTTKQAESGTGLGLSIVRSILTLHGGRISVESKPGMGTTFVIELPIAR